MLIGCFKKVFSLLQHNDEPTREKVPPDIIASLSERNSSLVSGWTADTEPPQKTSASSEGGAAHDISSSGADRVSLAGKGLATAQECFAVLRF